MEISPVTVSSIAPTQSPPSAPAGGEVARARQVSAPNDLHALANRELRSHQEVQQRILAQRDAQVRAHEQTHSAHIHGSRHYKYVQGPDGELYAVHGRVQVVIAPASSPEATIRKMETLIRAAGAPSDPSHGDRAVIALARRMKRDAEMEISRQQRRAEQEQSEARRKERDALQEGYQENPIRQALRAATAAYQDAGALGAAATNSFQLSA